MLCAAVPNSEGESFWLWLWLRILRQTVRDEVEGSHPATPTSAVSHRHRQKGRVSERPGPSAVRLLRSRARGSGPEASRYSPDAVSHPGASAVTWTVPRSPSTTWTGWRVSTPAGRSRTVVVGT